MKLRLAVLFKILGGLLLVLLIVGFVAPVFTADKYGIRLQASLERALDGARISWYASIFSKGLFFGETSPSTKTPAIGMGGISPNPVPGGPQHRDPQLGRRVCHRLHTP